MEKKDVIDAPSNQNGAAITAIVLIIVLVIAIAVVIILLVFANGNKSGAENINVGQITVNNDCAASGRLPSKKLTAVPKSISNQTNSFQETAMIPEYKGLEEEGSDLCVKTDSRIGIMNSNPDAIAKKWNPEKNFPSRIAPERPDNSLGSKFGPSEIEMQLYLPTPEELLASKEHSTGPKYIRRGPRYKRDGDWRPIQIPEDYKDYEIVRRPNRPRIDETYFAEAIEIERRNYEKSLPRVVQS